MVAEVIVGEGDPTILEKGDEDWKGNETNLSLPLPRTQTSLSQFSLPCCLVVFDG